jgi:hypothetical protein
MRLSKLARQLPPRLTTGGYILHSGLDKWRVGDEHAAGLHGTAANAFPFLKRIPPARFVRLLSTAEIVTGTLLLAPVVPAGVAGAALTAFSASMLTMYLRTPAMHKPGSIWPTPAGMGIAKDSWMLGIGLALLAEEA